MNAPFERKNSRQTLLFEGIAMLLVQDCPVSVVAERMGCNEKTIVRIMKHWVRKAWDKMKGAEPQCPAPVFIFRNRQITPRSTKKQSHRGSAIINLKFCKAGSNHLNSTNQSDTVLHSVRFDKLSE